MATLNQDLNLKQEILGLIRFRPGAYGDGLADTIYYAQGETLDMDDIAAAVADLIDAGEIERRAVDPEDDDSPTALYPVDVQP